GPWCNRLALQRSPYLLQHADNPVDWHPWGDAAFAEAVRRDVPVFLSIGYAACHWCHVMEHESFSDATTAALMNARFVNIKVDREERPDVDAFFMEVLLKMNGEAGWPASIWLTPDGRPFQGGTYYPPFFRYGVPAFSHALKGVSDSWKHSREYSLKRAGELCAELAPPEAGPPPELAVVERGLAAILESADDRYGGWGYGAKFPMVPRLLFLLETPGEESTACLTLVLAALDRGGIHDHIGGGFHRYAVDMEWTVPHFEKMLYDNALLAALYLKAWAHLGDRRLMTVGCETLEYILDDLRGEDGLIASSRDADDPGGEGAFYTWTMDELTEAVGRAAVPFAAGWSVTNGGNFEGRSVLNRTGAPDLLSAVRRRLLAYRSARPAPAIDYKRVVAWNAQSVAALALGGRLLGEVRYTDIAVSILDVLLAARRDGAMLRVVGGDALGVLDDYVALAEAALALHEATGEPRWLLALAELGGEIVERFWDGEVLSLAPLADKSLPVRRAQWVDSAEIAAAPEAVRILQVLHALGDPRFDHALLDTMLGTGAVLINKHPDATTTALRALRRQHTPLTCVVLTGSPGDPEHAALRAILRRTWKPDTLFIEVHPDSPLPERFSALAGKGEAPRVWICEGTSCRLPIRTAEALRSAL
ncbi:MAG: hypothetical protein ACI8RZ_007304, partial [Myxococcota bacterium]